MRLQRTCMLAVGLLLVVVFPALAREWTDSTGKFSVEAELMEVKGDKVVLKKSDGSIISVPIARLRKTDQEYLKSLGKPGPKPNDDSPAAAKVITNSIGMRLTLIPTGEFMMGSPDSASDARSDEKPQHRVRITKPFYLGTTEVTQGQYEKVTGKTPSYFGERRGLSDPDAPVEFVSWDDAQEFCRKLSELAEEKKAGRRYRLPTEAEWEYACRAGSAAKYCCGDDESRLGDYAWYSKNSRGKTHKVGQKKPNAWGLYDMHGNVEEWCADWYDDSTLASFVVDYYAKSPTDDPTGPSAGQHRVYRSGGFPSGAGYCRSACRNHTGPEGAVGTRGLRVLLVQAHK